MDKIEHELNQVVHSPMMTYALKTSSCEKEFVGLITMPCNVADIFLKEVGKHQLHKLSPHVTIDEVPISLLSQVYAAQLAALSKVH